MANGSSSQASRSRATTAPKGRPTRTRSGGPPRRRTFGSTFQWAAGAAALVVVFLVLYLLFFR
jgi:hypothetical protein